MNSSRLRILFLCALVTVLLLPFSRAFSARVRIELATEPKEEPKETEEDAETAENEEKGEESIYDIRQRVETAEKERLELLMLLGSIFSTEGKDDEAIEMYKKAFDMDPSDRELAETLLKLYKSNERWAEMIPLYEQFVERYKGENAAYYEKLVELYLQTGQEKEAFATLDRLLEEHSGNEDTYLYASRIYMERNRKQEALKVLEKGLEKNADSFKLNRRAASAYMEAEEYAKALEYFEAAKELTTSNSAKEEIEQEMMALYEKADIVKEIIARKAKELGEVEGELKELYVKQGEMKEKAGKIAEALESYRKLAALAPDTREGKMAAGKIKELESQMEEEEED